MDGAQDQGGQGKKAATARLHCLSQKEDPLLGRETRMQALLPFEDSVRIQGHHQKGGPANRLHGHARQASQTHGGTGHEGHPQR